MAKWRDVKQNRGKEDKTNSKTVLQNSSKYMSSKLSSRFKAFLTDTFLITTPILYIVIYLVMGSGQEFAENRTLGWGIIFAIHFIIIAIFWLKNGQTPGLKAYDLKLVDNKSLARISVLQVIIRYAATLASVISIFFMFTPYINKERKTFQDIVSNTKIIDS
ncbi:RDD family membrane protein [Aliarcobacter cibarius]|uniref:RDD family protein n=1 Tax=Aliarcobacter cibarius TaxID=255507 RepID=UPI001246AAD6|nr:RDD family protein [Aliarcobacter cibarius]QEZ88252.1 RDD family membrane protein [Aliarcobacter cibarius]